MKKRGADNERLYSTGIKILDLSEEEPGTITTCFLRIKVKRQLYDGAPSIAVFIADVTNKIRDTIKEKQSQKREEQARQAQKYTAMVS